MTSTLSTSPSAAAPNLSDLERFTLHDWGHWLRLLWPALLVIGAGAALFPDAVVATIASTPHPALVYAILGVCVIAIVAAAIVLHRYLQEVKYVQRWMGMSPGMRTHALESEEGRSLFMPVFGLLSGLKALSPESRQAAVSAELEAAETALAQRLELPNFLGGALVGLGLIGTFVGLLDTLDDLAQVFSALLNTTDSGQSPTQMFADMVAKLKAPMQGMSAAFVASFYGLLGSLIVSLMMVSVRKTAASSTRQIHMAVRQLGYGAHAMPPRISRDSADHLETLRLIRASQSMVDDLSRQVMLQQAQQDRAAKQTVLVLQELLAAAQATATSQRRTEEALQTQLASLRTALVQDRDNQQAAGQGARHDAHQLIRSIEECRTSFEQSARSLRAVLNAHSA